MKQHHTQIPISLIIIVSVVILGGVGYLAYETGKRTSVQIEKPKDEESVKYITTETSTTSPFEAEEMLRKKQRDTDRNKCISDAQEEYTKFEIQYPECVGNLGSRCLARMPKVQENIDRCYFRFPNN